MGGLPGGKLGVSAATKAVNAAFGSKSKKSYMAAPAAQSIAVVKTDVHVSKPQAYEFLFAHITGIFGIEFLLCPWQSYGYSGTGGTVSWDPQLLLDLQSKREYRCLSAELEYLGAAPSTATNSTYIGGARNPNTDFPEYDEFSLLEKNYTGPMFQAGVKVSLPHDNDWHEINTDVLITSSDTDKKVFASGIAFIAQDQAVHAGKYLLRMRFEFRGRDPVISSTSLQRAYGALSNLANAPNFSDGPRIPWTYEASITGLALAGVTTVLRAGYWLLQSSHLSVDDGVTAAVFTGFGSTDGSTDTSAARITDREAMWVSVDNDYTVGGASCIYHSNGSDKICLLGNLSSAASDVRHSLMVTRLSPQKAYQLYVLDGGTASSLPV